MSTRDRWLLSFLPSMLLLTSYWLLRGLPLEREAQDVQRARADLEAQSTRAALPVVDLEELERLRTQRQQAQSAAPKRLAALHWNALAASLERHQLQLRRETRLERGERALELEGAYLHVLAWAEELVQDPSAPDLERLALLETRGPEGQLRWSVVLP